ncbi:MAG: FG-GAP-like repeat-containing protein, partial [Candidatus Zixiibacteriota bacterium]
MVSWKAMLEGYVILTAIVLLSAGISFGQGLQVIGVDPAQNALDVPLTTDVVGEFDGALDPATTDSLGIVVFGNLSGKKSGTVTYTDAGQYLVTLDPWSPFLVGERIQAALTAQIHGDYPGHLPLEPFAWQFRVQALGGTGEFVGVTHYGIPYNSFTMAAADIDNDGDVDIAVTSRNNNTIGILRNNGDGTFVGYQAWSTIQSPVAINSADMNNDGYVDLLVGGTTWDSVAIMLNNGTGSFSSYTTVNMAQAQMYEIEAVDIDADGDLDLITAAGFGADSVVVVYNDGTGSFPSSHISYSCGGSSPVAAKAADVDNDGDMDVAVVNGMSSDVGVLLNDGGALGAPTMYTLPGGGLSLELVDLTGDGYPDMAIAPTSGSQLIILRNNGDGTFASYETYEGNTGFSLITTGDIDGDGDLDVVASHQGSHYISVFTNDGGTFDGLWDRGTPTTTDYVTMADFDGDSDLDIAYTMGSYDSMAVMFNVDVTSSLAVSDVIPDANAVDVSTSTEISVAFTTDINMSTVDNSSLTIYSPTEGKYTSTYSYDPLGRRITCSLSDPLVPGDKITVTVTEGVKATNGDAVTNGYSWSFTTETQSAPATSYRPISCTTSVLGPWQVAPSDIDQDHDVDLVTAGWGYANTAALRNDGGLSFTEQTADTTWTDLNNVCSADLNGDGYPDIVGWTEFDMDYYPYPLCILINNGDGTYTGDTIFPYVTVLGGLTAADLDNDGDIDLAASDFYTYSQVIAYWNDGAANFTLDTIADFGLTVLGRPYAVDFDGDGLVDIAVADQSATGFTILYNNGGTFSIGGSYSMGAYGEQLLSADLNGDLYPDFITASLSGGDRVSVLLSDGSGGFLTPLGYALGGGTLPAIMTGDADGDGDVDVTVVRYVGTATYGLQHLFNDGTGTLTMGDLIQSAYITLTGLCGADFDSDGDLDMAGSFLPSHGGDPNILIL